MKKVKRVTFSLSPETAMNLTAISERLGVSRSSLVENLLSGACSDMMQVLDLMPVPATTGDLARLRGKSISVIEDRLAELRGKVDAL